MHKGVFWFFHVRNLFSRFAIPVDLVKLLYTILKPTTGNRSDLKPIENSLFSLHAGLKSGVLQAGLKPGVLEAGLKPGVFIDGRSC